MARLYVYSQHPSSRGRGGGGLGECRLTSHAQIRDYPETQERDMSKTHLTSVLQFLQNTQYCKAKNHNSIHMTN